MLKTYTMRCGLMGLHAVMHLGVMMAEAVFVGPGATASGMLASFPFGTGGFSGMAAFGTGCWE